MTAIIIAVETLNKLRNLSKDKNQVSIRARLWGLLCLISATKGKNFSFDYKVSTESCLLLKVFPATMLNILVEPF